jgi:hypothetical protein
MGSTAGTLLGSTWALASIGVELGTTDGTKEGPILGVALGATLGNAAIGACLGITAGILWGPLGANCNIVIGTAMAASGDTSRGSGTAIGTTWE